MYMLKVLDRNHDLHWKRLSTKICWKDQKAFVLILNHKSFLMETEKQSKTTTNTALRKPPTLSDSAHIYIDKLMLIPFQHPCITSMLAEQNTR